jgi:hypothetical protein
MTKELENKIYDRFPKSWFQRKWGLEIGDGWFNILYELFEKIEPLVVDLSFQILQVKEKFGGLRCYTTNMTNNDIYNLIREAEKKAYHTCEICGEAGTLNNEGWAKVRCQSHWNKHF